MHQWAKKEWWSGRIDDPGDENQFRWHQKINLTLNESLVATEPNAKVISMIGYASDLGTKINQGRIGSASGPDLIRKELGNLAWHSNAQVIDQGNIFPLDNTVEELQNELNNHIFRLKGQGHFTIAIGGSHDMSYGHFAGLTQHLKENNSKYKLGVINFDAHLDLRTNKNGAHSGTPFLQMAQLMNAQQMPFRYLCVGVRKYANTKALLEKAKGLDVEMIDGMYCHFLHQESTLAKIKEFLATLDFVLLSIDMDGFKACHAPGVSAPAHAGYDPEFIEWLLPYLFASGKIIGFDLAETNPKFDVDSRTARLAAAILNQVIDLAGE